MKKSLPKIDHRNLLEFLPNNPTLILKLLTIFDRQSILAILAINRVMYHQIIEGLFQTNTQPALQYQVAWLRRAVICKEAKSLELTSLTTSRVHWWLSRKDITQQARWYGLLYSARHQDLNLHSVEGNHF